MNELVSVIIPTFNRSVLVLETLKSLADQTYTNWECIIVDDGSTDDSEIEIQKFIKDDNRFQYHKRPKYLPKGANSCRNYGFELSKGKYINWFDNDDIMLEDFLFKKMSAIESQTQIIICTGYYVNTQLENKRLIKLDTHFDLFKDYVLWRQHILTPSVLFKREFLAGKELFSLSIHKSQEQEFFSRVFYNQPNNLWKVVNEPLFLYRRHQESVSMQNQKYIEKYKESEVYAIVENLKRGLESGDEEIIKSRYRLLINLAIKAGRNNHQNNKDQIKSVLKQYLFKRNKFSFTVLKWCLMLNEKFNITIFRLDYLLKRLPIN